MAAIGPKWDGKTERRLIDHVVPDKMPEHVSLEDIWQLLRDHMEEEQAFRNLIEKSFPKNRHGEADFEGHGDYHTKLIERAAKAELARERIVEKVAGGSLWALMLFMGIAALAYLKDHVFK